MADWAVVIDGDDEQGGLREELVLHVIDITPQMYPEHVFVCHEYTRDEAIESMREARVFQVGEFLETGRPYTGDSTFAYDLTGKIKIVYPNGEKWRSAGMSDYAAISEALILDQTYPSGVDYRVVDPNGTVGFEPLDEGWQMMIVPLLVSIVTS